MTRRLLTVGHSYVIAQNRRLAHEMARAAAGRWAVTAVAPERLPGDLHAGRLHVAADEPCDVESLRMHIAWSPHLRFFDRRLRALLARPWDVVHVWQEPYVVAGAQVALCSPRSARVIPASFQNISKRYPVPLRWCEGLTMGRADGWIAFGETAHELLRGRSGYAGRPARVIPPGVDVQCFRPDADAGAAVRRGLGWPDRAFVVGFLGRFVPEKGLSTLMEALREARAPWRALFVGGGPLAADLGRFRAAHPERVRILTDVAHDDVPAHVNAMDVLCAPSRTTARWREQFGRMLIEAMACGVPVVASRSGEIPHVVADAGVLVPEGDTPAWAREIDRLLSDVEARRELAARGLARARERFAWNVVARAHLAFFEEVLG